MFHNNNNSYINKKLVVKIIKENKLRNIIIIISIMLTTVMLSTIISGWITVNKSFDLYDKVSKYVTDSDGSLLVKDIDENKIKEKENIEQYGIETFVSSEEIKNKELMSNQAKIVSANNQNLYDMMGVVPKEGDYPKEKDDVLLPTWVKDLLGVNDIGSKVILKVVIGDRVEELEFKLCGYYNSSQPLKTGDTRVFVSEEFTKNLAVEKQIYVKFNDNNNYTGGKEIESKLKKLEGDLNATSFSINKQYAEEGKVMTISTMTMIPAIIAIVLLIMLTGYLIIYNIFNISVSRDIRFYGLLKTIGTTPRQLKNIILIQGLYLAVIGIPLGLTIGVIISDYIIPLALKGTMFESVLRVDKSIMMFALASIFSLITIYISCSKPGRMAANISPIEASRYSDYVNSSKSLKNGKNGGKIYNLALRNMLKNRKRVVVTVLSMTLSSLMVIYMINIPRLMNVKNNPNLELGPDIIIYRVMSGSDEIKENLVEEIEKLNITKDVRIYYNAVPPAEAMFKPVFGIDLLYEGDIKKEHKITERNRTDTGFSYNDFLNTMDVSLAPLEKDRFEGEMEALEVIQGVIDKDKFDSGGYLIYNEDHLGYAGNKINSKFKAGDKVKLTFALTKDWNISSTITRDFEIMAIVKSNNNYKGDRVSKLSYLNISMNDFKDMFPDYRGYISGIDIDLKEGVDRDEADRQISRLILDLGYNGLEYSSINMRIKDAMDFAKTTKIIGGIIALILSIISILNIGNSIITDVMSRKIEFAMLESIGMTKKQQRRVLAIEGLYYIIIMTLIILPISWVLLSGEIQGYSYTGTITSTDFSVYMISILVVFIINTIVVEIIYRLSYKWNCKSSLVDRLRSY